MTTYEKRLLKFLQDNPTLQLNSAQIASIWKRKAVDVGTAMLSLWAVGKIKLNFDGTFRLNLCEGIGGA